MLSRTYPEGMHVVVEGFVTNMAEWMSACNCIVTKAGPGTIAESLICGLPVLLNGFIPCQEAGNVPFVLENQARSSLPMLCSRKFVRANLRLLHGTCGEIIRFVYQMYSHMS